jgi:ubiquitin-like protein Pup
VEEVGMPTRDSGEQQHRSRSADDEQVEETTAPSSDLAGRKEALDADIDAILDDIDEALETNAEEFVRGFVQKGGE